MKNFCGGKDSHSHYQENCHSHSACLQNSNSSTRHYRRLSAKTLCSIYIIFTDSSDVYLKSSKLSVLPTPWWHRAVSNNTHIHYKQFLYMANCHFLLTFKTSFIANNSIKNSPTFVNIREFIFSKKFEKYKMKKKKVKTACCGGKDTHTHHQENRQPQTARLQNSNARTRHTRRLSANHYALSNHLHQGVFSIHQKLYHLATYLR